jgi:hypothetical protein
VPTSLRSAGSVITATVVGRSGANQRDMIGRYRAA